MGLIQSPRYRPSAGENIEQASPDDCIAAIADGCQACVELTVSPSKPTFGLPLQSLRHDSLNEQQAASTTTRAAATRLVDIRHLVQR